MLSGTRVDFTSTVGSPWEWEWDLEWGIELYGHTLLGRMTDAPCRAENVLWSSPRGDTAALGSPGCFLFLDTMVPEQPRVVWAESDLATQETLALRHVGDRVVRLMDDGTVRLEQVDASTLPWTVTLLAEATVAGAQTLLAFDGRLAVAVGPAPEPPVPGARGAVWVVQFDDTSSAAVVTEVPVPDRPQWGLPLAEGLLFSSEEGVGAMSIACGR